MLDQIGRNQTRRNKTGGAGTPPTPPMPAWLAGAAIAMTILGMAGSAMALGAGLALS